MSFPDKLKRDDDVNTSKIKLMYVTRINPIAVITGLGYDFSNNSAVKKTVSQLY